jgi:flavin-dependent dehydrogenase
MGNCCAKPLFKIIKIGGIDVGIKGLEQAFEEVRAINEKNPDKLKELLLTKIKEYGNYVSRSRESIYKEDLFREYVKTYNS